MKVKFVPQNIEVEGNPNKTLLQVATENNIEIRSICKGVPSCAECRVVIVEGDNNILPPNKAELNLIGTNYFIDGRRLSCQVRCFGDVTVDLTEQIEKQENQTKKIRGFRTNKQAESHAVNDTMLLNEKIEITEDKRDDRRDEVRDGNRQGDQPRQEKRPQQQQQSKQPNKPQQNQQRKQGRRR